MDSYPYIYKKCEDTSSCFSGGEVFFVFGLVFCQSGGRMEERFRNYFLGKENRMRSIIYVVFDNLVQQDGSGIIGLTQNVKAIRPPDGRITRSNLWQPANIEEVGVRASKSAETFRKMFQS
jgi:hypothetical protein